MTAITIKNVKKDNIGDLCKICVPSNEWENPDYIKGVNEKVAWSNDMLKRWGSFAKIAYCNRVPAGFIQYEPIPDEMVVSIHCTFVPDRKHWNKGVASKLLMSLISDMRKPNVWFGNERPLALITHTFPGGAPGQLKARDFFIMRGFKRVGRNPDYLYLPFMEGFIYKPKRRGAIRYIPQDEDKGRALIICGPNRCPVTYSYFLKRMERYIREVDENIPIVWFDTIENSDEVRRRNLYVGNCVVNAKKIKEFVLNKDAFQSKVREAVGKKYR